MPHHSLMYSEPWKLVCFNALGWTGPLGFVFYPAAEYSFSCLCSPVSQGVRDAPISSAALGRDHTSLAVVGGAHPFPVAHQPLSLSIMHAECMILSLLPLNFWNVKNAPDPPGLFQLFHLTISIWSIMGNLSHESMCKRWAICIKGADTQ